MADDPRRKAEIAIAQLKTRKEMRSADLDEDSSVIEQEARSRRSSSGPPRPVKGLIAVLRELPPWSRPLIVLALIACAAIPAIAAKFAGWF